LPAVSEVVGPEALMITSIAVALLGIAVMMLTRPHPEAAAAAESEAAPQSTEASEIAPTGPGMEALKEAEEAVAESERARLMMKSEPAEPPAPRAEAATRPGPVPVDLPAAAPHRPARGANSLMAKVASLLPAGVAMPGEGPGVAGKVTRGRNGFQPASRFSRAQQAFLRIPIVLTGRDENGAEFREETCTLILLPQGAVIPMRQRVRAGDRMTLSNPSKDKESECLVYGAQPGPDGRMLVEVDFPEEKNMWPVSFPAWSGTTASAAAGREASGPARAEALDSTGS